MTAAVAEQVAMADWTAIGVHVRLVVAEPAHLAPARALLEHDLAALDLACSRFREDSELIGLPAGRTATVSPLLADAVQVALDAATATDGAVDPTLGTALSDLGYDADFAALPTDGPPVRVVVVDTAAWRRVVLDRRAGTVRLPDGVRLDLGATAKALGADRAARRIHAELGTGVLVSLGGDIAVAGPAPDDGWPVRVQDTPGPLDETPLGPACTVALHAGGMATSGTAARRWSRGGQWLHHLLDPSTGMPVRSPWRTVTVAAPSCVEANTASTATIVKADGGLAWLRRTALPARLVAADGRVTTINGWPV